MAGQVSHAFYIWSAYSITALVLFGLVAFTVFDWRRQQRLLERLEKCGAPRRRKPAARHSGSAPS